MQLPWDEHLYEIVLPAWQAYRSSEVELTSALRSGDEAASSRARYRALREAGSASFYLHHFSEIVLRARPSWMPEEASDLGKLRQWVSRHCTALRTECPTPDVQLLGDVADALKHAVLTRNPERRLVAANEAILVCESGYGGGPFGEGKFGGAEQVLVLSTLGRRALSGVLQNVVDAWRRAASLNMPGVGES
jgi:hypothetical protein